MAKYDRKTEACYQNGNAVRKPSVSIIRYPSALFLSSNLPIFVLIDCLSLHSIEDVVLLLIHVWRHQGSSIEALVCRCELKCWRRRDVRKRFGIAPFRCCCLHASRSCDSVSHSVVFRLRESTTLSCQLLFPEVLHFGVGNVLSCTVDKGAPGNTFEKRCILCKTRCIRCERDHAQGIPRARTVQRQGIE